MLASTGIILSSVTMIAPIAVPIAISAITALAGVTTAITKKVSSCSQSKLNSYQRKYMISSEGFSRISTMISAGLDDEVISGDEFSAITAVYNSTMKKLEQENINNNDNVIIARTTSTDSNKYNPGTNKHDINNINKPGI